MSRLVEDLYQNGTSPLYPPEFKTHWRIDETVTVSNVASSENSGFVTPAEAVALQWISDEVTAIWTNFDRDDDTQQMINKAIDKITDRNDVKLESFLKGMAYYGSCLSAAANERKTALDDLSIARDEPLKKLREETRTELRKDSMEIGHNSADLAVRQTKEEEFNLTGTRSNQSLLLGAQFAKDMYLEVKGLAIQRGMSFSPIK